jgi:hypothetical protein
MQTTNKPNYLFLTTEQFNFVKAYLEPHYIDYAHFKHEQTYWKVMLKDGITLTGIFDLVYLNAKFIKN